MLAVCHPARWGRRRLHPTAVADPAASERLTHNTNATHRLQPARTAAKLTSTLSISHASTLLPQSPGTSARSSASTACLGRRPPRTTSTPTRSRWCGRCWTVRLREDGVGMVPLGWRRGPGGSGLLVKMGEGKRDPATNQLTRPQPTRPTPNLQATTSASLPTARPAPARPTP